MQSDSDNTLIIAAAGSGKTTFLISRALDTKSGNILITTYTQANESEIKRKIIEINGFVPSNITVQTWFSFLIQHGVKPFQGSFLKNEVRGLILTNGQSGNRFLKEAGNEKTYYFTKSLKIYSDKLSKLVIRCNETSKGKVIDRISRIYSHIFIDEVQDLAGYDLEIIKQFLLSSSKVVLAGDPRQVTYLTHHEKQNSAYRNGEIEKFIKEKCKKIPCIVDNTTLQFSHRNNAEICDFASKLYPDLPRSFPCSCEKCRVMEDGHQGIFLVNPADIEIYRDRYRPITLRYSGAADDEWNFGSSKGLGFNRILIFPTKTIIGYLKTGVLTKVVNGQNKDAFDIAKFYVAVTRARSSVAIVCKHETEDCFLKGIEKFQAC